MYKKCSDVSSWPLHMWSNNWRVIHVINNGHQRVCMDGNPAGSPNLSTLKSVLLMYSKTSAGVLDCKERTTHGFTEENSRYH